MDEHVERVFEQLNLREGADERDGSGTDGELFLHHLEWLTELVWYTFRFEVHEPLKNSELAFQLSLEIRAATRRDAVGATAELLGRQTAARLAQWFAPVHATSSERDGARRFYDAMATLLMRQCAVAEGLRRAKSKRVPSDPLDGIALSVTFDAELEEALRRSGTPTFW